MLEWLRSDDFSSIKNVFELISYLVTIAGLVAVFFAIKTFKKSVEDSQNIENSNLMDKSMYVLGEFADALIPGINDYSVQWKSELDSIINEYNEEVVAEGGKELTFKDFSKELQRSSMIQAKFRAGGGDLLNKFERLSAYIAHNLVLFDVVYPAVHKVFISFYESNQDLLTILTSDEAPYKNLHQVYGDWKNHAEREKLDGEQKELNKKRKKLEEKRARLEQKSK